MKKLVLCLTLAAFASAPALIADDSKTCDQAKGASCCSEKAKATASTGACCSAKKVASKRADATSKGATLLVQR